MKYSIWMFIWDTLEIVYKYTRLRIQAPIELIFPDFGPWLFGKMIGVKGTRLKDKED